MGQKFLRSPFRIHNFFNNDASVSWGSTVFFLFQITYNLLSQSVDIDAHLTVMTKLFPFIDHSTTAFLINFYTRKVCVFLTKCGMNKNYT